MTYALNLENVSKQYGSKKILNNINLQILPGQIVGIVGPSGCGKSTMLRAILGTDAPTTGKVFIESQPVVRPNVNVGVVYQHYSLYEFLTIRENVALGLKLKETSFLWRTFNYLSWKKLQAEHFDKANELLKKVGLNDVSDLYPKSLSGGMRQRVAIAQAIITEPSILLLDEPFGALDEATREGLQLMLLDLYQENRQAIERGEKPPYTILIVTHELNEAIYVSDRIVGLSQYHADGVNGATIVYDKSAPVFHPEDVRDFEEFNAQKDEIRRVVMDKSYNQHHSEYVSFFQNNDKANLPGV